MKLTKAVLGFRMWPLTPHGLGAATGRPGWEPGVNTATCAPPPNTSIGRGRSVFALYDGRLKQKHTAPHADCSCGMYAWGTLDELREYRYDTGMMLYGAVAGWGKVIAHEQGWRAEKARVLAFALKEDTPFMRAIAELIADQYQVPLVPFDMLQLQGALYAEPLADECKPQPFPVPEVEGLEFVERRDGYNEFVISSGRGKGTRLYTDAFDETHAQAAELRRTVKYYKRSPTKVDDWGRWTIDEYDRVFKEAFLTFGNTSSNTSGGYSAVPLNATIPSPKKTKPMRERRSQQFKRTKKLDK